MTGCIKSFDNTLSVSTNVNIFLNFIDPHTDKVVSFSPFPKLSSYQRDDNVEFTYLIGST